jgi:hypothetical protein
MSLLLVCIPKNQEELSMRGRILAIALVTAALAPSLAWAGPRSIGAQGAVPDSKSTSTKWTVSISAQEPNDSSTSGPCTGGIGLADFCPVGPCDCYISTGTASGAIGKKGTAAVYETIDFGQGVGVEGDCTTAYFDIEVTGSKDTESIGGNGGDCFDDDVTQTEYVAGGCTLGAASTLFSDAEGQCIGSYGAEKNGNFPLHITITGKAVKLK